MSITYDNPSRVVLCNTTWAHYVKDFDCNALIYVLKSLMVVACFMQFCAYRMLRTLDDESSRSHHIQFVAGVDEVENGF